MDSFREQPALQCPLCTACATPFFNASFFACPECGGIFRPSTDFLTPEAEYERYTLHKNNPSDLGYRRFSQPLVSAITNRFPAGSLGLDFGSGPHSAASQLLHESGYPTESYDPFFHNTPEVLQTTYPYVYCCEVIEHFQLPAREFATLFSLLATGSSLFCMTHIYSPAIDFGSWYYKNDPTHVFIYREKTIQWISQHYGFSNYSIADRVVRFDKHSEC